MRFWWRVVLWRWKFCFRGVYPLKTAEFSPYWKDKTSEKALPKVRLTRWKTLYEDWGPFGFYYDAPHAFLLFFDECAIACLAFEVDRKTNSICINQVQGKSGQGEKLALLRWEKLLVNYVTEWARKKGFAEVLIQPAEKNRYYPKETVVCGNDGFAGERSTSEKDKDEERRRAFRMRYNVTAERLRFRFDDARGYYMKPL